MSITQHPQGRATITTILQPQLSEDTFQSEESTLSVSSSLHSYYGPDTSRAHALTAERMAMAELHGCPISSAARVERWQDSLPDQFEEERLITPDICPDCGEPIDPKSSNWPDYEGFEVWGLFEGESGNEHKKHGYEAPAPVQPFLMVLPWEREHDQYPAFQQTMRHLEEPVQVWGNLRMGFSDANGPADQAVRYPRMDNTEASAAPLLEHPALIEQVPA